jgi:hypothetical protein
MSGGSQAGPVAAIDHDIRLGSGCGKIFLLRAYIRYRHISDKLNLFSTLAARGALCKQPKIFNKWAR